MSGCLEKGGWDTSPALDGVMRAYSWYLCSEDTSIDCVSSQAPFPSFPLTVHSDHMHTEDPSLSLASPQPTAAMFISRTCLHPSHLGLSLTQPPVPRQGGPQTEMPRTFMPSLPLRPSHAFQAIAS